MAENSDDSKRCRICKGMFFINGSNVPMDTQQDEGYIVCSNCAKRIEAVNIVCPFCGCSIATSANAVGEVRHLKLIHKSGATLILNDQDILGKECCGKGFFKKDPYISGAHIKVIQRGPYFDLIDISKSGNSFILNMKMIRVGGTAIVKTGDKIIIGITEFQVSII